MEGNLDSILEEQIIDKTRSIKKTDFRKRFLDNILKDNPAIDAGLGFACCIALSNYTFENHDLFFLFDPINISVYLDRLYETQEYTPQDLFYNTFVFSTVSWLGSFLGINKSRAILRERKDKFYGKEEKYDLSVLLKDDKELVEFSVMRRLKDTLHFLPLGFSSSLHVLGSAFNNDYFSKLFKKQVKKYAAKNDHLFLDIYDCIFDFEEAETYDDLKELSKRLNNVVSDCQRYKNFRSETDKPAVSRLKIREKFDFTEPYSKMFSGFINFWSRDYDEAIRDLELASNLSFSEGIGNKPHESLEISATCANILNMIAKESPRTRKQAFEAEKIVWGRVYEMGLVDPDSKDSFGESKYESFTLKNSDIVKDNIVFKKGPSPEKLASEINMTYKIAEIVYDHPDFFVPTPMGIYFPKTGEDRSPVFIMRRAPGETLAKKIEDNDPDVPLYLKKIIDYLALIHAKIDKEDIQQGERDYIGYIKNSLNKCRINEELVNKAISNLDPILESYNKIKKVYVKDAHADNWNLSYEKSVFSLDNADERIGPLTIDLAKILTCKGYIDFRSCKEYVKKINNYGIELKYDKDLKIAFLNSVIELALSTYYYDTTSSKIEKANEKLLIAEKAIKILKLNKEYKEFYNKYSNNYKAIKELVTELKSVDLFT